MPSARRAQSQAGSEQEQKATEAKIYALIDPETNTTRYIGATIQKLSTRLNQHLAEKFYSGSRRKFEWLSLLRAHGYRPRVQLLEVVPIERATETEQRWIRTALNAGVDLVNNEPRLWTRWGSR